MTPLTGGCFCGRVRYEVRAAPFNATLCHCADCRRVTGAPAVAWFSVHPRDFVMRGAPPRRATSSPGVVRAFCDTCGTALTYARADLPDEVDVTTSSLDAPERVPPGDQTWFADRVRWMDGVAALPAHRGKRPPPHEGGVTADEP